VLVGLLTRPAVLPLLGIMFAAFITTKLPILLGQDLGPIRVRDVSYYGFWGFAHESRTDFAMVMGSLFLWSAGPGSLARRPQTTMTAEGSPGGAVQRPKE
jgi:putative oxidoreductase